MLAAEVLAELFMEFPFVGRTITSIQAPHHMPELAIAFAAHPQLAEPPNKERITTYTVISASTLTQTVHLMCLVSTVLEIQTAEAPAAVHMWLHNQQPRHRAQLK